MPAQHISYRLPFGFSNIPEREKNKNNGSSTLLKKVNLASSHLKQQISKTIPELVKSITRDTPIEFAEDESRKIIEICKDDRDVPEINYLEARENFLKVKIGEKQGQVKNNFFRPALFINIDHDNSRPKRYKGYSH